MKKKILFGLGIFAIVAVLTSNTSIMKKENNRNLTFPSLLKKALADEEQSCPGGTCSYTLYIWFEKIWECTACCQAGQTPHCDSSGCSCTN